MLTAGPGNRQVNFCLGKRAGMRG